MKIVELKGGLGNQMFQYAVARGLEPDKQKDIYIDLSYLNKNTTSTESFTARAYELGLFKNIRAKKLSNYYLKLIHSRGFLIRVYRKIIFFKWQKVTQKENELVEILIAKNVYLDGYFQSEKYFQAISSEIRHDFKFQDLDEVNSHIEQRILQENSVSIHIRRGDYVSVKECAEYHGVLPIHHYIDAIQQLNRIDSTLTYYIFSDDLDNVQQELKFLDNATFISGNSGSNSWKDMRLMSACKHHIIANSSFSWWGAWLSEREGTTIAPKQWFAHNSTFCINDFIPSRWVLL